MRVASPIHIRKARIEIIPLIDIMFFLLAQFYDGKPESGAHEGDQREFCPRVFRVRYRQKAGVRQRLGPTRMAIISFDKDEVADEELLNRLKNGRHQSAPDAKVFVRGDKDSVHLNVAPPGWTLFARLGITRFPSKLRANRSRRSRGALILIWQNR